MMSRLAFEFHLYYLASHQPHVIHSPLDLQEEEYKNALTYTKTMAEREDREEREKRAKVDQYRVMLMQQIESDEVFKHSVRRGDQDEGESGVWGPRKGHFSRISFPYEVCMIFV